MRVVPANFSIVLAARALDYRPPGMSRRLLGRGLELEEILMKSQARTLAPVLASVFFVAAGGACLNAQITNAIQAHVDHSFVIGDKTLPPGQYTFRIMNNSDLSVMTVTSESGKAMAVFNVRQAIDEHRPNHSELVFRRYGDTEFLSKVFESGSKAGVAVTETSKQETRLVNEGQHATEHSEEQ
jgi:hypothetical protein